MKIIKKQKGFTLIELIVVIAIIGILAAVLIPSITGYIEKARFSNDVQDASNMTKLVQVYTAERGITSLTANEVKTIVLTSGQYNLVPRKDKWTFVYNKEKGIIEAIKFSDVGVSAAGSDEITEPEEIFLTGYYLIGKGTTALEKAVDEIRNYDGTKDLNVILDQLTGSFSGYKTKLQNLFNPDTTLFINEKGTFTKASDSYATANDQNPISYVVLNSSNYNTSYIVYNHGNPYSEVANPSLYYKNGINYEVLDVNIAASVLYTKTGDDYNTAYIGLLSYKTVTKVVFGDSIAYVPAFSDKVKLPAEIRIPSTIEFISEGAFANVQSETKLSFGGPVVFENGFLYNDNMAKKQPQPITKAVDYEKLGIKLFNVKVKNGSKVTNYENDTHLQLELGDEISVDLESFKSVNQLTINGLDVRFGYNDKVVFKDGKAYYGKFTAKLFENGKLVGYCNVYYRDYLEFDQN